MYAAVARYVCFQRFTAKQISPTPITTDATARTGSMAVLPLRNIAKVTIWMSSAMLCSQK